MPCIFVAKIVFQYYYAILSEHATKSRRCQACLAAGRVHKEVEYACERSYLYLNMNTKLLMTVSALAMGITGIILSFLPNEVLNYFNATTTVSDPLILQILGALYFAFAMVNWTAKANLIGGIYARPIAIGNLTHFIVGSLALIKNYFSQHDDPTTLMFALVYIIFAVLFSIVFFRHPVKS